MKCLRLTDLSLLLLVLPFGVGAQSCNEAVSEGGVLDPASLRSCLISKDAQINSLQTRLSALEMTSAIPRGAVVAFDRSQGCPSGWNDMGTQWRGRSLVAAVGSANDTYGFGRLGGAETHRLTESEMPKHRHTIHLSNDDGNGSGIDAANNNANAGVANRKRIVEAGGSQPHNNMPPYVALFFCKKE